MPLEEEKEYEEVEEGIRDGNGLPPFGGRSAPPFERAEAQHAVRIQKVRSLVSELKGRLSYQRVPAARDGTGESAFRALAEKISRKDSA